jgi:hypothetical protein
MTTFPSVFHTKYLQYALSGPLANPNKIFSNLQIIMFSQIKKYL